MFSVEYLHSDPQLHQEVEQFLAEWNNANPELEVSTSGSTGKPKTIRLKKKHMRQSAQMTADFLGLKKGDTALLCLSPQTIAGKMMIVRAIESKMHLIIGKISANPLEHITQKIEFAAMVPLQVESCLAHCPEKLSSIEKLIIGGAPLSNKLIQALILLPNEIYHTFGMTETISHIAMMRIKENEQGYVIMPGVEIAQNDGRLVISAEHLGVNQLITNDEIELTPRGFRWLGRRDFVINSGGLKLHPETIEAQLSDYLSAPFFLAGIPDDRLGEALILCIESDPFDLHSIPFDTILPRYSKPKQTFFFPRFMYTSSGKINRGETLKLLNDATE